MKKQYAASIIYLFITLMTVVLRISIAENGIVPSIDRDYYFTLIVQILCFGVLPIVLYFLFCKNGDFRQIGSLTRDFAFQKCGLRDFLRTIVIAFCMVYAATVISFIWSSVLRAMGFNRTVSKTEYTTLGVLFLELFMTALLPATFEEITHRGLLHAGFRENGKWFVVVSALLFGLMHENIVQTGYTFFDGVVLALLVYYTGSIYPAIFTHFLNNAIAVLSGYALQKGGVFSFMNIISDWLYGSLLGFITGAMIFVIALSLMLWMFYRMRNDAIKKAGVSQHEFGNPKDGTVKIRTNVILWGSVAITAAATLFTLAWGLIR